MLGAGRIRLPKSGPKRLSCDRGYFGRLYKRDVDDITTRMEALIQPSLLIIIVAMVLVIALAVYLPYFSSGDIISPY